MSSPARSSDSSASSRREFMKSSGAIVAAGAIASELSIARSAHAAGSDVLKVGLVGCGGRGTGAAAQALKADKNVKLVAVGDAFPDALKSSLENLKKSPIAEQIDVPAERQFTGFDNYKKVCDSGIDVVLLAAPPHFRPEHMEYAVKAGLHVFAEKPVAVDALGIHRVLAAGEEAKKKNLAVVSGLCWRYDFGVRGAMEQVREGAIGETIAVHAQYNTPGLPKWPMLKRESGWSDMEYQLRNWYYYTWLSGDGIVEQAIHSLDKAAWVMNDEPPISCTSLGGLQSRLGAERGNIFDHHAVVYEYAGGVRVFFNSCQIEGVSGEVSTYVMGSKANCLLEKPTVATRDGKTTWRYKGPKNTMHQTEHDELFAGLRSGNIINNTQYMARSTMLAIMGRMASYTAKKITWEQAMNSQENMTPATYAWGPMPEPKIAIPGATKFV
ncbi:MAG: Gfo/Idh/MocA family oxidoreductase [Planctomycetia bacterium]|nr:Gfo/Idh/MocA family oxidoreductase [Planctomycetia bacterium]